MRKTYASINLNNLKDNIKEIIKNYSYNYYFGVVKANAYGHGAVEIALMAQKNKLADYLAIATVPEGMELREAGVTLPVLKLSPAFEVEMESAVANEIALCVCEEENIRKYDETARVMGKKAVVHLQLDTGMGRIGVGEEEGLRLAEIILKLTSLNEGVDQELALKFVGAKGHEAVIELLLSKNKGPGSVPLIKCLNNLCQVPQEGAVHLP